MRSRPLILAAALLAAAAAGIASAAPVPTVSKGVAVRMRDGVDLRADVHLPAAAGPFPTLVYRTPYDRKRASEDEVLEEALTAGYAVVLVDVRGRYDSGGAFTPYRNEGPDGYDTIEWAASQPWSTGAIGTYGLSYPGAVQWLAAVESPPHLKAMVPAMTFSSPRNFFYAGGAWDLSWLSWLWNNIAPDARVKGSLPGPRTGREARAEWKKFEPGLAYRLPLTRVPELTPAAPYYLDWLAHRPGDAWWDWADLRRRYGKVDAAVFNISGWYDEAYGPEGAMTNFLGLLAARRGQKDPRVKIVLGPWVHGGEAEDRSGERVFGEQARLPYAREIVRFMDRYVKGIENGVEAEPRVRAFVMGENVWRTGDTLPLPGTKLLSLYLAPAGKLGRAAPAAPASAQAAASASAFVSDPEKPVIDTYDAYGAHDYRALALRKDVLVFETEPLAEPLRVVGAIETEIFLSADAPDADLWVKLEDVAPDGTAWNLSSPGTDVLRVSDRDGTKGGLLSPGEVVPMRLPNLRTGNLFAKGHRVRIVLCGSFMPHFSRNLQTGESEVRSAKTRKATIRIHHEPAHPSRIVLPVVD